MTLHVNTLNILNFHWNEASRNVNIFKNNSWEVVKKILKKLGDDDISSVTKLVNI